MASPFIRFAAPAVVIELAIIASAAPTAHGQEPDEAVRFEYNAPGSCPQLDEFASQVHRRTRRARAPRQGESSRLFKVEVTATASSAAGTLVVNDGEHSAVRRIQGRTCDEVVAAMALMTALAIDPQANIAAELPAAIPAPPPPAPLPPTSSRPPASATPPPSEPPPTLPRAAPVVRPDNTGRPNRRAARQDGVRWGLELEGLASGGIIPGVVGGAGLWLEGERRGLHSWTPSVRGGVAQTLPHTVHGPEASATVAWNAARVETCPWRWQDAPVAFLPCVGASAVRMEATGSGLDDPRTASRTWIAWQALGRVQLRPDDSWWLEVDGGFSQPFVRHRFIALPGSPIFRVGAAGWTGAFGAGVRFP